jgi:NADP-dependent 3-hydroxy acid dehydrogenase YdfG
VIERHGRLDVAVACAGIQRAVPAHELALDDFEQVLGVNLAGVFLTCRAAARVMITGGHGGKLVLVGSVNSQVALPGQAAYAASKGGCCSSVGRWRSTEPPWHQRQHRWAGRDRHRHERGVPSRSGAIRAAAG